MTPDNLTERDKGINKALNHADRVHLNWTQQAVDYLQEFLAEHRQPFRAETFRAWVADKIPKPPHLNAWGGVFIRAKAQKVITFHSYSTTRNKQAHGRVSAVWVAA